MPDKKQELEQKLEKLEIRKSELAELQTKGYKLISYDYVISIIVLSFRLQAQIKIEDSSIIKRFLWGIPFTAISIVLGWWGLPWGLIYTPFAIFKNTLGGINVLETEIGENKDEITDVTEQLNILKQNENAKPTRF